MLPVLGSRSLVLSPWVVGHWSLFQSLLLSRLVSRRSCHSKDWPRALIACIPPSRGAGWVGVRLRQGPVAQGPDSHRYGDGDGLRGGCSIEIHTLTILLSVSSLHTFLRCAAVTAEKSWGGYEISNVSVIPTLVMCSSLVFRSMRALLRRWRFNRHLCADSFDLRTSIWCRTSWRLM